MTLNRIHLHFLSLNLLILAGLSLGILGLTGYNVLSRVSQAIALPDLSRVLYLMMGLAAILQIFYFYNKNTFFPETGAMIFPTQLINLQTPMMTGSDKEVHITVPEKSKYLVYWLDKATEAGVLKLDNNNEVTIPYKQGAKKLYYRLIQNTNKLSALQHVNLN